MDVFHCNLKAVECTSLGYLHLGGELPREVLQDDAVRSSEEREDVLNEVPLAVCERVPVLGVLGEVDLLGRPEGGLVLLVHLPDLWVLDREHHPPARVLKEKRIRLLELP